MLKKSNQSEMSMVFFLPYWDKSTDINGHSNAVIHNSTSPDLYDLESWQIKTRTIFTIKATILRRWY